MARQSAMSKKVLTEDDKNVPSFVGKLSIMLQDPTAAPFVSWSPSGESIVVLDPSTFANQVLPRYFKHSNFASFVRQLNLYGFHKTSQESDVCEFSHPMFRQGNEHVFGEIRRKVPTGSSGEKEQHRAKSEVDKLMAEIEILKGKQQSFEEALQQKEAEKQLIYSEMMQSKQRQEVLEQRMGKMVGVLVKACQSIGITPMDGDRNGVMEILDGHTNQQYKRRRMMVDNKPASAGGVSVNLPRTSLDDTQDEWLDSLIDSMQSGNLQVQHVAASREKLLLANGSASGSMNGETEAHADRDRLLIEHPDDHDEQWVADPKSPALEPLVSPGMGSPGFDSLVHAASEIPSVVKSEPRPQRSTSGLSCDSFDIDALGSQSLDLDNLLGVREGSVEAMHATTSREQSN